MNNKLFYLTALAAAISTSSFAGTMGDVQAPFMHASGWEVGGDLGYGYLSTQEIDVLAPTTITNISPAPTKSHQIGDLVGGGYLGYKFPMIGRLLSGLEIGYKYLGESEYNASQTSILVFTNSVNTTNVHIRTQQQAIDFLLNGQYFVWNKLNFIGKVGAALVENKTQQNYSSITSPSDPSSDYSLTGAPVIWRLRPEVSVGVGYSFNEHLDLNLLFTHIHGTDGNNGGASRFYAPSQLINSATFEYNAVTGGISYTF